MLNIQDASFFPICDLHVHDRGIWSEEKSSCLCLYHLTLRWLQLRKSYSTRRQFSATRQCVSLSSLKSRGMCYRPNPTLSREKSVKIVFKEDLETTRYDHLG